jgi:SAM-dependent methyltransferase
MENAYNKSIHTIREKEIEFINDLFDNCKHKSLLELGCGDGFQSKLLKKYFNTIISTDLNEKRMNFELIKLGISMEVNDAELVGQNYPKDSFDFIFSSNMLEHLPNYYKCLKGIKHILKNDGIAIIILPNTLWRLSAIIFHYPFKIKVFFKIIFEKKKLKEKPSGNNLKISKKSHRILNLLFPKAHGAYSNSIIELYEFSIYKWKKVFLNAGFQIVEIRKGPLSSGYRFGFNKIKKLLAKIGLTTEYIYVLKKA